MVTGVEDEQVLKGETDDHLSRFYGFGGSQLKGEDSKRVSVLGRKPK